MKSKTIHHVFLAVLLIAGAVENNATAAPVPVVNPSFETNQLFNGNSTTNWNARGNSGQSIQSITNGWFTPTGAGTLPPPADGTNFFVININGNPGWGYQTVGLLQSNTTYTLTIAIGESLLADTGAGRIALINGTSPFQTVLAQTPIDASPITPGTFEDTNVVFSTGYQVSGDLTILMEGDTGTLLIFDNVRLDATPLPQSATALPPTLSSPSNTVYSGTVVTLSENPGGAPPFHYQWRTDNGSGGATFSDVLGANSAMLAVDTTSFALNKPVEYLVIVTNSLGGSTGTPVALTAIPGQPVILVDTLPSTGSSDVVGSQVTFSVSFDGSRPITYQWQVDTGGGPADIPGATNSTLTITNLQFTDIGSYSLVASNALGVVTSTPAGFTVNPVPVEVGGIIASPANQVGLGVGTKFTPTWVLATNSLLEGASPTNSVGDFQLEGAGGIPVLTDGQFGALSPEGNASPGVATCGTIGSGAGSSISYMLPASATGWDLTNLVVYGGWSDNGRDWQRYQVYYSTTANPTNFVNLIVDVDFEPVVANTFQSATRVTITSTNGVLAKNVAGLQWYFNTLANGPENGYEGYAELQAFGLHSAPAPVLAQNVRPATGADVVGSQVTLTASFTSGTPMTLQWFKDGVAVPNATNPTLTLSNLQLTDTAVSPGYVLQATNASGAALTSPCAFTVNPAPDPDASGLIVAPAQQTGSGATFTPTWTIASGSFIAGALPNGATYTGNGFGAEGAGGVPVLTDGQFGSVGSSINTSLATAGGSGFTLIYLTPNSAYGYDLTNIVAYGGWSDAGRDVQAYTISYSTVSAPNTFISLDSVDYIPAVVNVPTATRVTVSSPTGGVMASNVAAVMFDFQTPTAKNGYQGYAELQLFGSPSAPEALAPVVIQDTLPGGGSDVVGSQVTFTATFAGAPPISYQWQLGGSTPIPGATTTTLTLSNLQLTNSGQYNLVASNAYGMTPSSPSTFTVNPVPAPVGGIIAAPANQIGYNGWAFTPTWTAAAGSLIAGSTPSSVGSGSFNLEGSGGTSVLTDGGVGRFAAGNSTLATAGTAAGTSVTYTLTGSSTGYDLNETVVYAGWSDSGRDGQGYTISYSTVANPTTFTTLTSASYNPAAIPGGIPSTDRLSIYSASGEPLARNVAAVQFTFANVENGYSGYAQIQVFGVRSSAPITVSSTKVSAGHLVLTGSGGTPGGAYSWLTSTNAAAPLSTWTIDTTGAFDTSGNFSNAIPINTNVPAQFFRLKTP